MVKKKKKKKRLLFAECCFSQQMDADRAEQTGPAFEDNQPELEYVDKQPSFLSLDNPVVATVAILGGVLLLSNIF